MAPSRAFYRYRAASAVLALVAAVANVLLVLREER
jgi:hypothetical protein